MYSLLFALLLSLLRTFLALLNMYCCHYVVYINTQTISNTMRFIRFTSFPMLPLHSILLGGNLCDVSTQQLSARRPNAFIFFPFVRSHRALSFYVLLIFVIFKSYGNLAVLISLVMAIKQLGKLKRVNIIPS